MFCLWSRTEYGGFKILKIVEGKVCGWLQGWWWLEVAACAVVWMELWGELFGQIYYWCVQLLEHHSVTGACSSSNITLLTWIREVSALKSAGCLLGVILCTAAPRPSASCRTMFLLEMSEVQRAFPCPAFVFHLLLSVSSNMSGK